MSDVVDDVTCYWCELLVGWRFAVALSAVRLSFRVLHLWLAIPWTGAACWYHADFSTL